MKIQNEYYENLTQSNVMFSILPFSSRDIYDAAELGFPDSGSQIIEGLTLQL